MKRREVTTRQGAVGPVVANAALPDQADLAADVRRLVAHLADGHFNA